MVKIIIDKDKCDLCKYCIDYCPTHVFRLYGDEIFVDETKCIECYACIPLCPRKAIKIVENNSNHNMV